MAKINLKDIEYDSELAHLVEPFLLPIRFCPKCNQQRPMLTYTETTTSKVPDGMFGRHTKHYSKRFRCPACLTLWDEYEGKVVEDRKL